MVRVVSLSVLLTLIVILGLTFFRVLAPFILPLFLAAVFAILCQPVYVYFLDRTANRVRLAAGLTTGAVISVILIPLIVGTVVASLQLYVVATNLSDRNIGRALREATDPVLQSLADFINSRTQPRLVTEDGEDPDPIEGDDDADAAGSGAAAGGSSGTSTATAASSTPPADDAPAGLVSAEPALTESALGESAKAVVESESSTTLIPGDATQRADVSGSQTGESAATDVPPAASSLPSRRLLTADDLRLRIQSWIQESLSGVSSRSLGMAGGTFNLLSDSVVAVASAGLGFVMFAVAFYYFLADGTQLVRATEKLIPVHVDYQRQMLTQFSMVVRAVVMATFFAALAQAIATVAALWLLDFDHLFIIFVLALLMSMIPMMGTWLVWLPCACYLLYSGHWFQALLLTVYGAAFVGMLDNVVRTYILNTDVKLHPLLALISVLGGLQVMGLWGMFVGPIVASCLHALVKIFNHELYALSKERFAELVPVADGGRDLGPAPSPSPARSP